MLVPHDTHILVVDGARMQILRNAGQGASLDLKTLVDVTHSNPASHVMESDAPGHSHESSGPGGHAYDASDLHQRREDEFIEAALERLVDIAGHADSLIVIAPPRALGHLRSRFDYALRARIVGEMNKDLAHRPVQEIAMFLRQHQE